MRPSSMKNVEKALSIHLSEQQMDEALTERVALVKELAPEVPRHVVSREPKVIATEDIEIHTLSGLKRTGSGPVKLIAALVVALLAAAGAVGWWQHELARAQAVVPPQPLEAPAAVAPAAEKVEAPAVAPAPEVAPAEEPVVAPPAPPEVKAAPVRVKKHKKR
jgi:hypothetical protein